MFEYEENKYQIKTELDMWNSFVSFSRKTDVSERLDKKEE